MSKQAGEIVAVVDCGASAIRASIAEIRGRERHVLEELSRPVDLTGAFRGGLLDRPTMDAVVQALADIRDACRGYGVERLRAVGTSAFREAGNADILLERIRHRLDLEVEVIDGAEEARLYFEALRWLMAQDDERLPSSALLMDVGSGATIISLIRGGKLVHATDDHFGAERTYEEFAGLRDSLDYVAAIERFTLGATQVMLDRLPKARIDHLFVAGSEPRRLLTLLGGNQQVLALTTLEAWLNELAPLGSRRRAERCGCDPHSAALMIPVGAMMVSLGRNLGLESIRVPRLNMRDGLLADFLPGSLGPHHLGAGHLLAAARQLSSRYGMDLAYADNTAAIAGQIFDQTVDLHHLNERARILLQFAALVHDLGAFINIRNRHKHSYYIVRAADLPGLTAAEKEVVAHVARYHRRSTPKASHIEFQALPREQRVLVRSLAAILRLAYALDVERTQRIKRVTCEIQERRLFLHVDRRQVALERWSLASKKGMFEELFGVEVVLSAREED